jgi:hypothetical protein
VQTTLEIKVTRASAVPHMFPHAHDLPGFPRVMCINIENSGNKYVPRDIQHAMLVPEGMPAPELGDDRTVCPVPADYAEVDILLSVGIIDETDHVVMQMTIRMQDGSTMVHTHVACPFL